MWSELILSPSLLAVNYDSCMAFKLPKTFAHYIRFIACVNIHSHDTYVVELPKYTVYTLKRSSLRHQLEVGSIVSHVGTHLTVFLCFSYTKLSASAVKMCSVLCDNFFTDFYNLLEAGCGKVSWIYSLQLSTVSDSFKIWHFDNCTALLTD